MKGFFNFINYLTLVLLLLASSILLAAPNDFDNQWDAARSQAWTQAAPQKPTRTASSYGDSSYVDEFQAPAKIKTSKKSALFDDSTFDEIRIHLGVSLLQSYQKFNIAPGVQAEGGIRGFQLGLGVDLFSPHWIAQGLLTNYPTSGIEDTTISSNAFELRLIYDYPIMVGVTVHGGAGIGNRYYNIKTQARTGTNVDDGQSSFNSGAFGLVVGAEYWPTGEISGGIEFSHHTPMASSTDPTSYDLGIQISGHF